MLPACRPEFEAAVRHNARVTCASAAGHFGLWLREPPAQEHLACNHGHGSGFIRHRTIRFDGHPTLPVAAIEDVVLHAMVCLAPPASTAIATSAMRLHGVPLELLKCQLTGDRSGPVLKALHLLDLRAESIVEVDAQHLFRSHGIGYDAQVYLPGIGRVDFLIEGFLIVEVDGFAFHSSREALRRDLGRNNASTLGGYAVLRYMPSKRAGTRATRTQTRAQPTGPSGWRRGPAPRGPRRRHPSGSPRCAARGRGTSRCPPCAVRIPRW